jgi:hypothetical protein
MSVHRSVLSAIFATVSLFFVTTSFASAQSAGSAAENPRQAFESWLETFNDPSVSVVTNGIAYDQGADRLTVSGMTFTFNSQAPDATESTAMVLTLNKVDLNGFETPAEGISFRDAVVEGLQLKSVSATAPAVAVENLVLQQVFLPSVKSFTADRRRPISSQVALLRLLTAASADKVTLAGLRVGDGVSAENVEVSTIALGAAERIELKAASSVFASAGEQGAAGGRIEANSIVVTKVDFDPYLRLFEASAYLEAGAARPWRNLIEKIEVTGLTYEGQGTRVVTDMLALSGLKARQFPQDITELFDKAAVDPAFLASDQNAAADFTAAIRGAFAIDAISVGATSVKTSNAEGEVIVSAASGTVSGLAADRIAAVDLTKLSYTDTIRSLQAEIFRLENINLPTRVAGQAVSERPASVPQVGTVKMAGFQGKVGEAQFAFGQFNLDMAYFLGGTPTNVKLVLDNLKLSVAQIAVPAIRDTLAAFGYQEVDVSLALAGSWQERSSEIAVENAAFTIAGLGKLSASGSLTGITRAGVEDPAARLSQELSAGGLKNFRLLFENETFFQSLVKEIAKENSRTDEEISKALASNMPAIMQNVSPAAIKNKLIFAGVSFVNDPRSLEFVSSSTDVVSWSQILAAFAAPASLPGLLQLDVRANGRQ